MKTRGLILMACLLSGTVFAQNTTLKTEQSAKVNVRTQPGSEGATVKGNTTVKSENGSTTAGTVALKKEISGNSQLLAENASEVKGVADQKTNAAIETSNSLSAQAKQSAAGTAHQLKSTLNSSAAVSGNLMNATRIKTGPLRINTQIISRSGLIIR